LDTAIQGAMNQLGQDLKADNNWETQDRNNDLASGRVGVDRFGNQVRMSNNLIRTAPDTVVLSTLSQRTTGPNQGVTSASLTTQYNQALPDSNWLGVVKLALTDPANLDNKGSPIWWQIQSVFTAANPVGDSLVLTTLYSNPYLNVNAAFTQDYIQDLWAYSIQTGLPSLRSAAPRATFQTSEELYYNVVTSNPGAETGILSTDAGLLANPTVGGSASSQVSFTEVTSQLGGGIQLAYVANFFGTQNTISSSFTQTFHILDGQGNLQPLPSSVQSQLDGKTFGGIDSLNFIGVDRSLNIETSFDVPGFFKQPIDLLVMPEIFDGMGGVLPIFTQPQCNSCG
jgi:hypothetical protein